MDETCQLGRYAPTEDTISSIEFTPSASPVTVVTENYDLSSTLLERTLPFLGIDLAVTEVTLPSLMVCSCGSGSTLLSIQQRAVVENVSGNVAVKPATTESMSQKPAVKRKYDEI